MNLSDKDGRRDEERPAQDNEDFLRKLNARLRELPEPGAAPKHPILFTTGSPRSGTTILAQSVCRYFDTGYVDGLAAKFWEAPQTGLMLSKLTFADRKSAGQSYYGRTGASDIHGFHYFWMKHFKLDHAANLFEPLAARAVDWPVIRAHLAAMEAVHNLPMVYKGYYPGYFMEEVCQVLPTAVFVLIERDPLMQGLSIYRARERLMKDMASWWSIQPPGFERLLGKPVFEQIAGQIFGLKEFFDRQLKCARGKIRIVRLTYDDLIERPEAAMKTLASEIAAILGRELPIRGEVLNMKRSELQDYPLGLIADMKAALKDHQPASRETP